MLLGRPIAKALGMAVDFLNDRIKYDGGEWRAATLGRHHEYLLPLTEDFEPSLLAGAAFDLILEDEDGPGFTLEHFQQAENVFLADETTPPEGSLVLKGEQLKSLDTSVLTRLKAAEAYIPQTLHDWKNEDPESSGKSTVVMGELLKLLHRLAWRPRCLDLKLVGTFP